MTCTATTANRHARSRRRGDCCVNLSFAYYHISRTCPSATRITISLSLRSSSSPSKSHRDKNHSSSHKESSRDKHSKSSSSSSHRHNSSSSKDKKRSRDDSRDSNNHRSPKKSRYVHRNILQVHCVIMLNCYLFSFAGGKRNIDVGAFCRVKNMHIHLHTYSKHIVVVCVYVEFVYTWFMLLHR